MHVPYKGGPLALNDLLGGSIDVVIGQIKADTIKALAVSSLYRLSSVPNVPTFLESGVSDVELTSCAAFSASSRLFDLNGAAKTPSTKHSSVIMAR